MKKIFMILSLFLLVGCGAKQQTSNFYSTENTFNDAIIIEDTVSFLEKHYPPATTKFSIEKYDIKEKESSSTIFYNNFIAELRKKGFAVLEKDLLTPIVENGAKDLYYIVDILSEKDAVRLSLYINKSEYSKIYPLQNNSLINSHGWTGNIEKETFSFMDFVEEKKGLIYE